MTVARAELQRHEVAVYQFRHEAGVQSMRSWLIERQAEVNRLWLHAVGDELLWLQGEGRGIARLLKLIEKGPDIKLTPEMNNG